MRLILSSTRLQGLIACLLAMELRAHPSVLDAFTMNLGNQRLHVFFSIPIARSCSSIIVAVGSFF
jgi:hypothetical protein